MSRKLKRLPRVEGLTDDQRFDAVVRITTEALERLHPAAAPYAYALARDAPAGLAMPIVRRLCVECIEPGDVDAAQILSAVRRERRVTVTHPGADMALAWFVDLIRKTTPYGRNSMIDSVATIWLAAKSDLGL